MGEETAYCICRTSDSNRFMIGCDCCNEWYHGDCISITEEFAKTITKFYCLMCRDKNPSLKIEYLKDKSSGKQGAVRKKKQTTGRSNKMPRIDEGNVKAERMDFDDDDDDDDEFEDDDDRDETFKLESELSERSRRSKPKSRPSRRTANTRNTANKSGSKKTHRTRERERETYEMEDTIRQCYGPGCIQIARRSSKYCSEECGIKLAHNRIVEILPQRIRAWQSTGSSADSYSHRELQAIRMESEAAKKLLEELDVKQKELEAMIAEAKKLPPISEDEEADDVGDAELMTYCVTCGHEVASRTATRHMERCFNKFESQTSYGSLTKTKVDGVFCDVYNPQQKTYCMRLKVLCPEHTKEQRISDTEVCGFPLVTNCFELTGTYCRLPKKKCMRHYSWEKLRRAQLDMEKVQKWLKLEELFEKEQKIRFTMSNRGAVLGLLLHETIYE